MIRYCSMALLLLALAQTAGAAEAVVTKVRGAVLNVDKGADQGLVVGMEVMVVRPPGEAIIHPITGENLGSPEIRLAAGEVAKVSANSGVIRLKGLPLMAVRNGDVIRFVAPESPQAQAQQAQQEVAKKEEAQERQQLKTDVSGLTRDVRSIQERIKTFETLVQKLDKMDKLYQTQMRGVNSNISDLRQQMRKIQETVEDLRKVPVKSKGEAPDSFSSAQLNNLRKVILEEINNQKALLTPPAPPPVEHNEAPPKVEEPRPEPAPEPKEEETQPEAPPAEPAVPEAPFYTTTLFMGGVGGVGLLLLGYYLFNRLRSGKGDEEEEEEEEPEAEVEVEEEEEEDDIVVEESK